MSKFFFFTDPDLLDPQTADQAFGPVSGQESTQYRLTSVHTAATSPKVYAVCDGVLFSQEQPNGLLNLILVPSVQPKNGLPPVRFYIYRGVSKDSLFQGAIIADRTTNDLTNRIWEIRDALVDAVDEAVSAAGTDETGAADFQAGSGPSINSLGANLNALPGSTPLETILYPTNAETDFQFPVVEAGWHIGTFEAGTGNTFGFEVVLENLDEVPTLADARAEELIYSVPPMPASPTDTQVFRLRNMKEHVLNYVDPCAFFGSFFEGGLHLYGHIAALSLWGDQLYDAAFTSYYNRNTVYLDIRNNEGYSFNYFGNYTDSVRVILNDDAPVTADINYYQDWPILALKPSDLAAATSVGGTMQMGFQLPAGDNTNPLYYFSRGLTPESSPKAAKHIDRFVPVKESSGFTEQRWLHFHQLDQTGSLPVSSYNRIFYLKRLDYRQTQPESTDLVLRQRYFLDHLFAPFDLEIPFPDANETGRSGTLTFASNKEVYVDQRYVTGSDWMGKAGIAVDEDNVTFFVVPVQIHGNGSMKRKSNMDITTGDHVAASFVDNLVARHKGLDVAKSQMVVEGETGTISVAGIRDSLGSHDVLNRVDKSDYISLTMTRGQYDELLTHASAFASGFKVFLGVGTKKTGRTSDRRKYISFEMVLRGYQLSAQGELSLLEIPSGIVVYKKTI